MRLPENQTMRAIEFFIVVIGTAFTAYFFLDNQHAGKVEQIVGDYEVKIEQLELDLNRDEFARRTYESQNELSPGDARRHSYIVSEIERKQKKIEKYEDRIEKLQGKVR